MNSPSSPQHVRRQHQEERRLNSLISRVLVVGLLASMALLAVGVILNLIRPNVPVPHSTTLGNIPAEIAALEPAGFYALGLLVLLATPFARVVALGVAFARMREWLFAGISLIVTIVLILAASLGLTVG
jgi:uncharacterized membrane protein